MKSKKIKHKPQGEREGHIQTIKRTTEVERVSHPNNIEHNPQGKREAKIQTITRTTERESGSHPSNKTGTLGGEGG